MVIEFGLPPSESISASRVVTASCLSYLSVSARARGILALPCGIAANRFLNVPATRSVETQSERTSNRRFDRERNLACKLGTLGLKPPAFAA